MNWIVNPVALNKIQVQNLNHSTLIKCPSKNWPYVVHVLAGVQGLGWVTGIHESTYKQKTSHWVGYACLVTKNTLFCYNYALLRTDDNVSILHKIKSHKRPVHLLFMVSTFATIYYQYVILSILHKEYYKTLMAKRFLSCFTSTWDF